MSSSVPSVRAREVDALLLAELASHLGVLPLELRGAALDVLTRTHGIPAALGRVLCLTRQLVGRRWPARIPASAELVELAAGFTLDPDPDELALAAEVILDPDCSDELLVRLEIGPLMSCFIGVAAACLLAEGRTPAEFIAGL